MVSDVPYPGAMTSVEARPEQDLPEQDVTAGPSDAYVNSLAIQADQAAGGTEGATPGLIGGITGSGQAVSIDTLSVFLTRLEQVKGWVNPWMSTVSKNEEVNG